MSQLAKIHKQKKDAEVLQAIMQVHCALLADAIDKADQSRAEFQLGELVKLVHGPLAYVEQRPFEFGGPVRGPVQVMAS